MAEYTRGEAKDWAREHIKGVFSAPCLPETADGRIDEAALRQDIRYLVDVIKAGGLYIHGFYGNFWLLTIEERKKVFEVVVDEVRGAVPVSCRCAHQSMKDTIDLIHHAEAVGADFISLLGPALAGGSEEMILSYFEHVAAETSLGLSIFNTPQTGYVISPELMARLAEIPNVVALKNHLPMEHTLRIRRLVGDRIQVIDPEEENFLINLVQFGQRAIYTGTNYMFDTARATPMRDYVQAALNGEASLAAELYYKMEPIRKLHHRWVLEPWARTGRCPISTIKWWTQQLGMAGGPVRPPLPEIGEADKAALRADLVSVGLVEA